ncbi:hypothetical protein [Psychrobacter sp. HII-4]|uniref:hypothetical protein n=1 Tax=Psychrobacter sp. HII-4 TaxID=1569264 RepID=UPI00191ACB15|nr:hypothetical protein [Psychrobacter sp. HII-4]
MSSNNSKDNLQPQHEVQAGKRSLPSKLLEFMVWVVVIGLLLSPIFCIVQYSEVTHEQR